MKHFPLYLTSKGRLIEWSHPVVMGILNTTPDSFYANSRIGSVQTAIETAQQMLAQGADILDVGGYSTRPGAAHIPVDEELKRVIPVVKALRSAFPSTIISIDTFRAEVAEQAIEAGADMVNDVGGGRLDENMWATVARLKVPYVLMHSRGTPQNMMQLTQYQDLVAEVLQFFAHSLQQLRQLGANDIIIDPGFGFAKTIEQNFELLHKLHLFQQLDCAILVGVSRKSMIWKTLNCTPEEALPGTSIANFYALQQGAHILRVHDVLAARHTIQLYQKICLQELSNA